MKTHYLLFFCLVASLCLFVSCGSSKDEPDSQQAPTPVVKENEPYIEFTSIDIRISAEAQTVEVLGKTNFKWSTECVFFNDDPFFWAPILLTDGEYVIVKFDVTENTSDSPRVGDIVFKPVGYNMHSYPGLLITQEAPKH